MCLVLEEYSNKVHVHLVGATERLCERERECMIKEVEGGDRERGEIERWIGRGMDG